MKVEVRIGNTIIRGKEYQILRLLGKGSWIIKKRQKER